MSRRDRVAILVTLLLAGTVVAAGVRLARRPRPNSVELARAPVTVLAPATRDRIERLDEDVLLSWYATPRARMPSSMRSLEDGVVGLLRAMEAAGAGRVRVQVVDPTSDPALPPYLAALGIAPVRARSIAHDGWTETSVWSSLRVACGGRGATTIAAVTPELLPHLQTLIVAHLDELQHPRRPRVALAAPPAYVALRKALAREAELLECDFDASARAPRDADLLVWIDPERAGTAHLAALEDWLARGRSVVVAGSARRVEFTSEGNAPAVGYTPTRYPADTLLAHFGLAPVDGVVTEAAEDPIKSSPLVLSIGPDQDFRAFGPQPNGTLLFRAPTPFLPDARRLAELDLAATTLASSSNSTLEGAELAPHLPLLVSIAPADPLGGRIVFAASSSPFADEYLKHEAFAHEALVRTLVSSLASTERRAMMNAAIERPARLAELPLGERLALRGLVVVAIPLLLGLLALQRGTRRVPGGLRGAHVARQAIGWAAAVLVLARATPDLGLDFTRGRENGLARETRSVLDRLDRDVTVELVFSPDDRLPPEMRPLVRSVREAARRMDSASGRVDSRNVHPEDLGEYEIAVLAREGIRPARVTSTEDEATTIRRVYSAVVARSGDRLEVLPFPDTGAFEHIEFRLAFAIDRLRTGRDVTVAVASDVPRPSPAETQAGYQKKGLFAPSEGDVYSEARELLALHDFRVVAVDPRAPSIRAGTDLFLWLQPRRDVKPTLAAAASFLAAGGKAVIAAQHHVVLARRRQANDLAPALWPEPQFPDVDREYFRELGLELVDEVLLDELHGSADIATRVEREDGRFDAARETSSSPLLVRAVPAGFDSGSPIVRGLSDQMFAFGNRLRLDDARLAQHGIIARPLIRTSARCWSYSWQGGDLPESILRGPATEEFLGRQPLAVEMTGRFPSLEGTAGAAADGEVIVIGCSEMFKNGRLRLPGYDHAQLLLNSAAIALDPDLAAILARHPPGAPGRPGLDWIAPQARTGWRIAVLGAGPLLVLMLGFAVRRRRERATP